MGSYVIQEGSSVLSGLPNSQKAEQTGTGNAALVSDIHPLVQFLSLHGVSIYVKFPHQLQGLQSHIFHQSAKLLHDPSQQTTSPLSAVFHHHCAGMKSRLMGYKESI